MTKTRKLGKEICDLLVVFGNDIIIFSDKRITYSQSKSPEVAWSRWARKAVIDSHSQAIGARRWITEHPERIYMNPACSIPLPVPLPESRLSRFHLVIVCHGIEQELLRNKPEASFSHDLAHTATRMCDTKECLPFTIGKFAEDEFVHAFTGDMLHRVLVEFDTAVDFLSYLRERKRLLTIERPLQIESESEIVRMYFESDISIDGTRDILSTREIRENHARIGDEGMEGLSNNIRYLESKRRNKISYLWDFIIQDLSSHILHGTFSYRANWTTHDEAEVGLRKLAATSRFQRRRLADALVGFFEMASPVERGSRIFADDVDEGDVYVFVLLPLYQGDDLNKYRELRRYLLELRCLAALLDQPKAQSIVGIAARTRTPGQQDPFSIVHNGIDYMFLDVGDNRAELLVEARKARQELLERGLLQPLKKKKVTDSEFPTPKVPNSDYFGNIGSLRNLPCPCGSGRKSKKCCFRMN